MQVFNFSNVYFYGGLDLVGNITIDTTLGSVTGENFAVVPCCGGTGTISAFPNTTVPVFFGPGYTGPTSAGLQVPSFSNFKRIT